ncbi:MAG: N-acetylmuramic acid 6-phosphate etherase [Chloroflexota bacterium]|nr:N-acetylmuramic acid 6-phosphate etherase [Chloroflexota bacterium]
MSGSHPVIRVESPTEARNPRTLAIDTLPTMGVLELLNDEDAQVAPAVRAALPALAEAVEAAVARYEAGGTIHYFGAGTSGRIGTLDAAELPPTFSADPLRAIAHHAGGAVAVDRAVESAEDDRELGRIVAEDVAAGDIAVGLTASGRTPYVLGALEASKEVGALTVLVSSAPGGRIAEVADVHVFVDTGPEAIAGSTRLKAGTAQKMVLNSFSTAIMIRLGKTYSNLMVDVTHSNAKLRGRVLSILEEATGAAEDDCARALEGADGDVRTAIVILLAGASAEAASAALERADRHIRVAIAELGADPTIIASTSGASGGAAATTTVEVPME